MRRYHPFNTPYIVRQTIVYSDGTMVIYKMDPDGNLIPDYRKQAGQR